MAQSAILDASVELPPGLEPHVVQAAAQYIERNIGDLIEIYFEQPNVFSAIVGILGTRALDSVSAYEKHRHAHTAQQRFPDLCRRGHSSANPRHCLESKGSKRPWSVQSHYDHPGWYIVWRYLVDPTESIEAGKAVIIWRVEVVFLEQSDWKYEKSAAGERGGGRTHTFGVKNPAAKLENCAVFRRGDIVLQRGKPVLIQAKSG
jgi:hypothetical protein